MDLTLGPGEQAFFKIDVNAPDTLMLQLSSDRASAANELFLRRDAWPAAGTFDASTKGTQANVELLATDIVAGSYFLKVNNRFADGPQAITLSASQPGVTLRDVNPKLVGASLTTLELRGTDLPPDLQVTLKNTGGTEIPAANVQWIDSTTIHATIDLQSALTGNYSIHAHNSAEDLQLLDAVNVEPARSGLEVDLTGAPVVRTDRLARFFVTYRNTGNHDLAAPLMWITSDTESAAGLTEVSIGSRKVQYFLGIADDGPAGILRAGQSYELDVAIPTQVW